MMQKIIPIGVGLLITSLLMFGSSSTGINFADSQDLLLAAANAGLAHPPGYAVLIMVYRMVHAVLPFMPLPTVGALISAVSMGTVSIAAMAMMMRRLKKLPLFIRIIFPLGLILNFITIKYLWVLASIPEVMAFSMGLAALLIWCVDTEWDYWAQNICIGILSTLLFMHHPLMVGWIAAALFWHGYRYRGLLLRHLPWLMFGVLIGFGITQLSALSLTSPRSYGWLPPQTLEQWWQFWSRQTYDLNQAATDMYRHDWRVSIVVQSIWHWWFWLTKQVGIVMVFAGVAGLFLIKRRSLLFMLILALVGVYGIALPAYLKTPSVYRASELSLWYGDALRERMFYPLFLSLFAAVCVGVVYQLKTTVFRFSKLVSVGVLVLLMVGSFRLYRAVTVYSLKNNDATHRYGQSILTSLPQEAVLIVDNDEIFNLLYIQQVNHVRPDIKVIPTSIAITPEWYRHNDFSIAGFRQPRELFAAELVSWNMHKNRRVFIYHFDNELLQFLGVEGNPFYIVPHGYTLEVTKSPPDKIASFDYGLSVQLARIKIPKGDAWFKSFQASLGYIHTQLMYYTQKIGQSSAASFHQEQAENLAYLSSTSAEIKAIAEKAAADRSTLGNIYAIQPQAAVWWYEQATSAAKLNSLQAEYLYSRVVLLEPANIDYWQQLGKVFASQNKYREKQYVDQTISVLQNTLAGY